MSCTSSEHFLRVVFRRRLCIKVRGMWWVRWWCSRWGWREAWWGWVEQGGQGWQGWQVGDKGDRDSEDRFEDKIIGDIFPLLRIFLCVINLMIIFVSPPLCVGACQCLKNISCNICPPNICSPSQNSRLCAGRRRLSTNVASGTTPASTAKSAKLR